MTARRTWIVGIDLRSRSDGAVRFGAWLHAQAPGVEVLGLHVLKAEDGGQADERRRAKSLTEEALERAGVRQAFARVEVIEAERPEKAFESRLWDEGAHGLILGRRAAADSDAIIRLGTVARRVLRRLVVPTFVVPPELTAEEIGAGPIVVAVTPDEASVGAVKFARRLAAELRRSLVFVTVVSTSVDYIHPDQLDAALAERVARKVRGIETATQAWLLDLGVREPVVIRRGDVLGKLFAAAAELAAPFVVCGSRQLGAIERAFGHSVASELAAHAALPVLVVPSDVAA